MDPSADYSTKSVLVDYSRRKRVGLVVLAVLQNFAAGGVLYGWASLDGMITRVYDKNEERDTSLSTVFVVATMVNNASNIFTGGLLDKAGPKVCSAVCLGLCSIGSVLFAWLCSSGDPSLATFYLSFLLLTAPGPGVQASLIHLSNLFPHSKSLITSIITGAFSLSFAVFELLDKLNAIDPKVLSVRNLFLGYAALLLAFACSSLWFWPSRPYSARDVILDDFVDRSRGQRASEVSAHDYSKSGKIRFPSVLRHDSLEWGQTLPELYQPEPQQLQQSPLVDKPLRQQLCSGRFVAVVLFMSTACVWANLFIPTVRSRVERLTPDTPTQDSLLTSWGLINALGVLGIPAFGWLLDNRPWSQSIAACNTLAVAFGGMCVLLNQIDFSAPLQIVEFVCISLWRCFLFNSMFAYVGYTFGFKNFGMLTGLMLLVVGLIGLVQIPLKQLQLSYPMQVDIGQLACLVGCYLLADYLWLLEKRAAVGASMFIIEDAHDANRGGLTPITDVSAPATKDNTPVTSPQDPRKA